MKARTYTGYPLGRIAAGIRRIHGRHRNRISPRGKLDNAADDIRFYVMTFGFNDINEFHDMIAARTSASYARRLIGGHGA